jgi:hypothetical protein
MLKVFETGYYQLVDWLVRFSGQIKFTGVDPFRMPRKDHGQIVNILIGMDDEIVRTMIRGQLHTLFRRTAPNLPRITEYRNRITYNPNDDVGTPHIYAQVHCSITGITPTPNEYLKALDIMERYVALPQAEGAWEAYDRLARDIDRKQPIGRHWSEWTAPAGEKHPRRY